MRHVLRLAYALVVLALTFLIIALIRGGLEPAIHVPNVAKAGIEP